MKIPSSQKWAAVCVSILAMIAALKSSADQEATAPQSGETYEGTIATVDPQARVLDVKGSVLSKRFNLSDTCAYVIVGKDAGSIGDLHPGQQVTVNYHINSAASPDLAQTGLGGQKIMANNYSYTNDVLVADRVQQGLMTCYGTVRTNDLTHHTLMLRFLVLNKTFQIPDDCRIILADGRNGAVTDIQSGNYVTVTYETPGDEVVAHEIAQTNAMYIGKVTRINQTNRTIEAAIMLNFNPREFHLADNCAIVVDGRTNGQLSDLKICEKLAFIYNNVKGVNIVSCITNPPPMVVKSPQMREKSLRRQARSPRMQSTQ